MALCWVTGVSGTGKSTIVREMQRAGELAWDADDFGSWRHRESGAAVVAPEHRSDGWVAEHAWVVDPDAVRRCRADADGRIGYLAGAPENEADVWHLFDTVVYLVADDDTLRTRLAARTDNDFGKHDVELAMVLGWNAVLETRYRDAGAVVVDARRPVPVVVQAVRDAASSADPPRPLPSA